MSDEPKVKIELLYGFNSMRSEASAKIVGPRGPRNALEAAWWALQALFVEVVIPAFWFALSVTAFWVALR